MKQLKFLSDWPICCHLMVYTTKAKGEGRSDDRQPNKTEKVIWAHGSVHALHACGGGGGELMLGKRYAYTPLAMAVAENPRSFLFCRRSSDVGDGGGDGIPMGAQ